MADIEQIRNSGVLDEMRLAADQLRYASQPEMTAIAEPDDFATIKAKTDYEDLMLPERQAIYDQFVQSELPKFLPGSATEADRLEAADAFMQAEPRPREIGVLEGMRQGFMRGFERPDVGRSALIGSDPDEIARQLADVGARSALTAEQRADQQALSDAINRFDQANGFVNSSREAINVVGSMLSGGRNTASMLAESIGGSMPSLVGAGGGLAVGGPIGMMIGLVAGNVASNVQTEIGQRIESEVNKAGIDLQDTSAVSEFLKANPELVAEQVSNGGVSGLTTAAVESAIDVATMGAGRLLSPATSLVQSAARAGGAVAAQGAAEGAGSAAGSAVLGEDISGGGLLVESLLGAATGIPDAALTLGGGQSLRDANSTTGSQDVDLEIIEDTPLALPAPGSARSVGEPVIVVNPEGAASTDAIALRNDRESGFISAIERMVPSDASPQARQAWLDAALERFRNQDQFENQGSLPNLSDYFDQILAEQDSITEREDAGAESTASAENDNSGVPADGSTPTDGDATDADGADAATIPAQTEPAVISGNDGARTGVDAGPATTAESGAGTTDATDADGLTESPEQVSTGSATGVRSEGDSDSAATPVVLQNRNRASGQSIDQMVSIGARPNYAMMSPGRQLSVGTPVVIGESSIPAAQMGRQDQAVDASGESTPVQYAVVEADTLLPSHTSDGFANPTYENGESGKLRVVAGNGRSAGLQRAFQGGRADDYVQDMISDESMHAISPETIRSMNSPVLVRVMQPSDVTADMGDRTNISGVSDLDPVEAAANDARRIDLENMEFGPNGEPTSQSLSQFLQSMPQSERSAMVSADGQPNRKAKDRLMGASFKSAYEDDRLVDLAVSASDPEIRTIINAMYQVAGDATKLRGLGDMDLRPYITEAAQIMVNVRRSGRPAIEFIEQVDLTTRPESQEVARIMASNIRSAKRMAEALRQMINMAALDKNQTGSLDMFGQASDITAMDIIQKAANPDATLLSRTAEQSVGQGMSTDALRNLLTRILRKWRAAPGVTVVPTLNHPSVPSDVIAQAQAEGAQGEVDGFFYNGRVYLVADQLRNVNDVTRVLLHESLGHYGLARTFGDQLVTILESLARSRPQEVANYVRRDGGDPSRQADRIRGAEELLAYMAQTEPSNGIVSRAVSAITRFIRAIGFDLAFSDADIVNSIIAPARRNVELGGRSLAQWEKRVKPIPPKVAEAAAMARDGSSVRQSRRQRATAPAARRASRDSTPAGQGQTRMSRRGPGSRVQDDPRSTENFADNQQVLRFAEDLRLPPRTLSDIAIDTKDPKRAARLLVNDLWRGASTAFADWLRPLEDWVSAMDVPESVATAIIGGIRRAPGVRGAMEREAEIKFGLPMRKKIIAIARDHKIGTDQALQAVGRWMTANYTPSQNAWLLTKDDRAINEARQKVQSLQTQIAQQNAQMVLPAGQIRSPLVDQLIDANNQLQKLIAHRNIRESEINDTDLGRSQFEVGVAGGLTNAQAARIKADIESKIPEAQIRAAAQHGWDAMQWKINQDLKSGKLTQQVLDTWPNDPEYVPTTGDPRDTDYEDLITPSGPGANPNTPTDREVQGRRSSVSQDGVTALFEAIAKSSNFASYQDFKAGLNAAWEQKILEGTGLGMDANEAQEYAIRELGMRRLNGEPNIGSATNEIVYRNQGQTYRFQIDDDRVNQAIRRENMERVPTVISKLFQTPTRIYARLVTIFNLMFAPTNSIMDIWERSELIRTRDVRDDQGQKVNTDRVARSALASMYSPANMKAAIRRAWNMDANSQAQYDLEEFIELGGLSTWGDYLARSRDSLQDQIRKENRWFRQIFPGKAAQSGMEFLMAYNQAFDMLSSLAMYQGLVAEGVPKKAAAHHALDLMNFRKTGSVMMPLKAMFVFSQPIVTGGYNLIRGLNTRTGQKRFVAYTALGYMLYSLLKLIDEDNEDEGGSRIDQLGSWTTERNITIPVGDGIVKIPVGFGMPQMAWGTAIHLTRLMSGEETPAEASAELIKQVGKTISPMQPSEIPIAQYPVVYAMQSLSPTLLKPLVNLGMDRNTFGNRITPMYPSSKNLKSEQPKYSTPPPYNEVAVWMQRNMGFDVYPEQIRTIINGYMVGPFNELLLKPFIENPNRERLGREQIKPYVSRFFAPFNQYALMNRAREAFNDVENLSKERASRRDRNENLTEWMTPDIRRKLALYEQWNRSRMDIRNEKSRATRAANSGKISEDRKQRLHDIANKKQDEMNNRFLRRYRLIIDKPTSVGRSGGG